LPALEIVEAEPATEIPTPESLGLDLPDDPAAALPLALKAVAEAQQEADRYLDDLRRVAADFDNYRKRSHRELAGVVERASERVLKELLPVLDSFEAALAVEARTETEEKLLAGMRGTYTQLLDVLIKEGLEPIATWYEPFDPEVHEAVLTTGGGGGPLMVSQELRRGYRLRGKVLRAALVAVGPGQTRPTESGEPAETQ
jgi:molecular chaperone GrpE